jgi:ribosome biogenesis protein SSF1/2
LEVKERKQGLTSAMKKNYLQISQDVIIKYNIYCFTFLAIILKRGRVGPYLRKLVKELRTTMYPYTAINLKESKSNSVKDYLSIVDVYGLSHMMMVTNTDKNSYIRFSRMPRGPTVTLKINDYALAADIYEQKTKEHDHNPLKIKPKPLTKSFNHIPLVIMNGFNSNKISEDYQEPVKITAMLLQSFFPPINLNEIQLKKCKRVVLFNLTFEQNDEGKNIPIIEFRHFDIDIEKYSMKKTISNIINNKKTDLSKFDNISDYILKQSGYTSGSDNEDPTLGLCEVIQDEEMKSEKNKDENGEKIKVKLHEIGPRLNLKIQKIEEGFLKGNVTFHSYMKKSKKEIKELMDKIKEKRKIKKERKQEQEENVQKKKEEMTDEQKDALEKG